MYADRRGFVLLCQPKTGSTTARYVCHRLGNGTSNFARVHLTHATWREHIRKHHNDGWLRELADDPDTRVYGTARGPVGWYTSAYRHAMGKAEKYGERWLQRWGHKSSDFADVLRAWTSAGAVPWPDEELFNPNRSTKAPTLYQASVRHYYGEHASAVDGLVWTSEQSMGLADLLGVSVERVRSISRRNVSEWPAPEWSEAMHEWIEPDWAYQREMG